MTNLTTTRSPNTETHLVPLAEDLIAGDWEGRNETTCKIGCEIAEPDGKCEHGFPTWLRHLGMI